MIKAKGFDEISYFTQYMAPIIEKNHSLWGWPTGEYKDLELSFIPQGLTNKSYLVKHKNKINKKKGIFIKRFNQGDLKDLIDRAKDSEVSEYFGKIGLSPQIFYQNEETRVELYLEGYQSYTKAELMDIAERRRIAYNLSRMHNSQPLGSQIGSEEEILVVKLLKGEIPLIKSFEAKLTKKSESFNFKEVEQLKTVQKFKDEVPWLLEKIKEVRRDSRIAFSHNDFYFGNIMRNSDGNVRLLDFEYSDWNLRTYDIAKLITELSFEFKSEGEDNIPSNRVFPERRRPFEEIFDFLVFYLYFENFEEIEEKDVENIIHMNPKIIRSQLDQKLGAEEVTKELEALTEEYKVSYLLVHLIFSMIGILMAKSEEKDCFDFVDWCYHRYIDYLDFKKKYFK